MATTFLNRLFAARLTGKTLKPDSVLSGPRPVPATPSLPKKPKDPAAPPFVPPSNIPKPPKATGSTLLTAGPQAPRSTLLGQ